MQRVIDSKLKGFLLERMSRAPGGLLPTAMAPQIVVHLLPRFEARKEKRKIRVKGSLLGKKGPIGLLPVEASWVNALMQFILHVPGFVDFFYFIPKSFSIFQEFIEQYGADQQEGRMVSLADGAHLLRFIRMRLSGSFEEVFQFLVRLLQTKWEVFECFEEGVNRRVGDLFLLGACLKRQFFSETICYDLDAFIEYRPDGDRGAYFAYVKVEGVWYQCDDDRITQLKSHCLSLALQRSILLHYKRLSLGR